MLRRHLTAYVTDHDDATLQLTGGQDSRILLSAIPPELRRGCGDHPGRAGIPGRRDRRRQRQTGLRHQVEALESLEAMPPEEAYALCAHASARLEGMADPVALAALSIAEEQFDQGHRIAGLGGEVARGFYYLGAARPGRDPRASARLATWRMFANEAITRGPRARPPP